MRVSIRSTVNRRRLLTTGASATTVAAVSTIARPYLSFAAEPRPHAVSAESKSEKISAAVARGHLCCCVPAYGTTLSARSTAPRLLMPTRWSLLSWRNGTSEEIADCVIIRDAHRQAVGLRRTRRR
jgi:hypothetical protein